MARRTANQFSGFDPHIQEHLDRARRTLMGGSPGSPNFCAPYMEPPVDVYQTETHTSSCWWRSPASRRKRST